MLEWISVKERLPETGKNVLVCFQNGDMAVACVFSTGKGFTLWRTIDDCWTCKCGHWMPLPKPPKEGVIADGNCS